jgi:methionine synthase II (cobalamin-independent)
VTEGLWTTSVGSLPKPPEIIAARAEFAKGKIDRAELKRLERRVTEDWVRF